jgi:hypothetical protein
MFHIYAYSMILQVMLTMHITVKIKAISFKFNNLIHIGLILIYC